MKLNTSHALYKTADAACSRPQLVLMLCDGAIRYSRRAAQCLRQQKWPEKGQAVESALECLAELRRGLDLQAGGDTAANLDRMYDFLATKLILGNAAREPEQFEQVAEAVKQTREAWAELFDRLRMEGKLAGDPVGV